MKTSLNPNKCKTALTLIEMVIAMSIIIIVLAAILPQFRIFQKSLDSKQSATEIMQNARILTDHINKNLTKATKITAVSNPTETNGHIQFEDNNGNEQRYQLTNNYIQFGGPANLQNLAGPATKLQFQCFSLEDLNTTITDVDDIGFVKINTTLADNTTFNTTKDFATAAFLYTYSVTPSNILQPIVYEPFNYLANASADDTPTNAVGLTGNWSGADSRWQQDSLTYSTLPITANHMRFNPNKSGNAKANLDPAAIAGYTDDEDTLWFSVIVNNATTSLDSNINFIIGDDSNGMGFSFNWPKHETAKIRALKYINGTYSDEADSTTYTINDSGPHLIIGKILFGATDRIDIYLPGLDLLLPASYSNLSHSFSNSIFNKISFDIKNGNTLYADEFRMGTTYNSVIGAPEE